MLYDLNGVARHTSWFVGFRRGSFIFSPRAAKRRLYTRHKNMMHGISQLIQTVRNMALAVNFVS